LGSLGQLVLQTLKKVDKTTATEAIFRAQNSGIAGTADRLLTAAKEVRPVCDARPV